MIVTPSNANSNIDHQKLPANSSTIANSSIAPKSPSFESPCSPNVRERSLGKAGGLPPLHPIIPKSSSESQKNINMRHKFNELNIIIQSIPKGVDELDGMLFKKKN